MGDSTASPGWRALCLAAALLCFLGAMGCSDATSQESRPADKLADGPKTESSATPADVQALAKRLKMLTQEVEQSPERRVYGVNIAANFQADQDCLRNVRKVVMNVNVYCCDDGCVDGPAETPTRDEDLLLLLPFAPTIKELDLQHTEITDAGLQTLAKLIALESLNLAGSAIRGSGLAHLKTLTRLEHLDLSGTKVDAKQLQPLGALPSLRTVWIPAEAITDDVLAVLGRLTHLKSLALGKSPVTDRGLGSLAQLQSLETLDLSGTQITDQGLAHLANLTNLISLQLSQTQITGAGLRHLKRLTNLQHLDLTDTLADDAGLAHLSGMRRLESFELAGTRVLGFGLVHLSDCRELHEATLPPLAVGAVEAVNAVKSWRRLTLALAAPGNTASTDPAKAATIDDMPELAQLNIKCQGPLDAVRVVNCPRLSQLSVAIDAAEGADAVVHLDQLPDLRYVQLQGAFRRLEGPTVLGRVASLEIGGVVTSDAVRAISQCQSLQSLHLEISDVKGDPAAMAELSELPRVESARIQLGTSAAAWILRLVGRMPTLKKLDLRGRKLTAEDLAPLCNCTQVNEVLIRGVDDPGEPLAFLDSMPQVDQCLALGCPRVGRVRLTEKSGVRRFYFKYGQLDALEIDGAPNLTDVYLGNRAFGYNDSDARLPRLDIGRLAVRNAAELRYLMVDAQQSNVPFSEIEVADCPKLNSLTLHAPPPSIQPAKCKAAVKGDFPQLYECKLYHLATDAKSLAQIGDAQTSRRRLAEDVEIVNANKEEPSAGPGD